MQNQGLVIKPIEEGQPTVTSYLREELENIGFNSFEIGNFFDEIKGPRVNEYGLSYMGVKYVMKSNEYNGIKVSTPQELYNAIHANDTTDNEYAKRIDMATLEEIGFTDAEIQKYFDYKMVETKKGNFINFARVYVLKEGININGQDITSVKDLVIALEKTEYFTQLINSNVEKYANGNEKLKAELLKLGNEFFENYNNRLSLFSSDLDKEFQSYVENWNEWKDGYSDYQYKDYENFAQEFESGQMPFADAIRILKEAGAEITMSYDSKDVTYGNNRFEKIVYKLNGQEYSVFRIVNPEIITNETQGISDDLKSFAKDFSDGKYRGKLNEAITILENLGAENIMKESTAHHTSKGTKSTTTVSFDYNGKFYQVKYVSEFLFK